MKASIALPLVALLIILAIAEIDGKPRRFSYGRRYYRPYPVFARPRAVWHAPPTGLRYRQLDEYEKIPKVQPGIRKRTWFVKPNAIRRRILRSTPCVIHRENSKVMAVIREALRRVNERRSTKLAVESVGTSSIRTCRKCESKGRCRYDHTKVGTTVTFAPTCKSGKCKCGFEIEGMRLKCHLSGTTKYGMRADNMTVQCKEQISFIQPKHKDEKDKSKLVPVTTSSKEILTTKATIATTAVQKTTTEKELITDDKAVDPGLDYDLDLKPDVKPAPILSTEDKVLPEEESLQ